ncbi:MAG: hypothetical protein WCO11_02095 [Sphingomonadales bacterium]|jgi:ElaB/YqjD/DUF883 family membrane-anchored ribosome-binding protein
MTDPQPIPLPIDASDWSDDHHDSAGSGTPLAVVDFARSRLAALVEEARDSLVGQVRGLKSLADTIHDQFGGAVPQVGGLAGEAAATIDRIADALADKTAEDLVEDGRALVRDNPAAAVGLAIAVGFLAGRMLKAAQD